LDNNWRGVSILSQEKGVNKFSSWDTKRTRQRERQRHTSVCLSLCLSVFLSVCLSVFYRDEMSLMKSDNKNQREREREKERINSPERIRRRISVLLKSRPRVCWTKKKFLSRKRTF
jgi:hypothetical protein